MMKKKNKEVEELTSLTVLPYTDFTIEELELRLETDPLFVGNLFNFSDNSVARCSCKGECTQEGCEHTCSTCYGIFIDVSDCPDYNCTPVYCACVSDRPCPNCPDNNPMPCPMDWGGSSCPDNNPMPCSGDWGGSTCPGLELNCPSKLF